MKFLALALAATLPTAALAAPAQAQYYDSGFGVEVNYHPGYGPGFGMDVGYHPGYDPGFGAGYDPGFGGGYDPGYGSNISVGNVIDIVLGQLGGYSPATYPVGSRDQVEQYKCNALHQRGQYADTTSNARFTVGRSYGSHVVKTWHNGMRCRATAVGHLGQWVTTRGILANVSTRFDLHNGSLVENTNGHKKAYPAVYQLF